MWLRHLWQNRQFIPPVGFVRFGSLRRVQPISRVFGFDQGRCIDRYYIENFLVKNAQDIQGHVLEIGDDSYSRKFGGERLTNSAVLHVTPGNLQATLVSDLETGEGITASAFDCIIITQTIHLIYDLKGVIANAYAVLKSGGVMLATFPGINQINRYNMNRWGDYWRFTTLSARKLFGEVFPTRSMKIEAHGNVLITVWAVKPMQGDVKS